ncbi:MAG: OmpA family protein [Paludibacteraceae bacterium]|nr:OmpA family protein [Paludibacteraceae bacterium]
MKKATSILLTLSTAFGCLSAQNQQSTLEPAPDFTTNGGQPIGTEVVNAEPQTSIHPLFEPENKFLSLGFGGGINTLKYDIEIGERSPMAGGVFNLDYNIFFGGLNSEKKIGLSFGVGAAVYNAKSTINVTCASTTKIPVTYYDGTTSIEDCNFFTEFNDWVERQTCIALETPIGLIYRKHLRGNTSLFAGGGLKLMYPIKTTYRVKSGSNTSTGHLGSADLDLNANIPQHGYTTSHNRPHGTTDTKHVSAGIYFDLDFVHKNINADFFYGIYGTLGLSSIRNDEYGSLSNIDNYCGVLNSTGIDNASLRSIGIKLGVKIPCPRLKDNDHDGIYDKYDKCLNTPAGVEVDTCGCPVDTDKDSVPDYLDKCPNTPKGVLVDSLGCPLDGDGDGVPDYLDKCPNTPDSVEVDAKGCPIDSDRDGVADYLDKCPNTPVGRKVDKDGCPYDSDGDGVNDVNDKCPDTPEGITVDAVGCPIDTDRDGVPDYLDKCPTVKGPVSNNGCPVISAKTKAVLKQAMHGIQFETNKAVIKKTSYPVLDKVVKMMKENPRYKLNISGHTDNVGKPEKNMKLSKDRAAAVVKYLTMKGIRGSRLKSFGYGDTKPIASNDTESGRKKNRRVDFEVEF